MDLVTMNALASDQTFQKRVFAAAVVVARELIEAGPPATDGEMASLQLAFTVFADASGNMSDTARLQAKSYTASIVTDPQVQLERDGGTNQQSVTDATIIQALRDSWVMLAGKQPTQP